MTPEAKGFLLNLHGFVQSQVTNTPFCQPVTIVCLKLTERSLSPQVKLFSELGKIEGSLQELQKMKRKQDVGQYSIEIIEIF